ncbi:MAG: hypothetical protein JSR77_13110 [Planctomycetes bacterium]|nr:hypothetical protein [Planctomycetota bacterium]
MSGPMCLVSGRVKELLIGAECKGASFHPVVVYDRKDAKIVDRDTWWLRPQRGSGRIDTSRGSFLINSKLWRTDPELKDAVGLFFDPNTWTGLDVFLSAAGYTVFVTTRIAEVLQNAGVTMIELDPAPLYGKKLRDDLVADLRKRWPERFKPRSG